jgi:hypothetical protein
MRWGRARRAGSGIDLRGAEIDRARIEVVELHGDQLPPRPPLEPLAGLSSPPEAPYARASPEPGSLRGLWEALSHAER